jgi:Mrp family chromosome partitioning ATPase
MSAEAQPEAEAAEPAPAPVQEATAEEPKYGPVPMPRVPGALQVFGKLRNAFEGRRSTPATPEAEIDAADARLVGRLASRLAESIGDDGALDIMVVGADAQVDAGGVALSLARFLSDAGRKVIIVDMAGRSDSLRESVAGGAQAGLAELIAGEASFADAIHRDRASPAHIVPAGTLDRLAEASPPRFEVVLEALGLTYDFVLLLTNPAESQDRLRITQRCGAAILVSSEGANDPATVAAHNRLTAEGIEDVIVLLTPPSEGEESRSVSA